MTSFLFTSESVSEGHPDKVCDQISDAVVDLMLRKDAYARIAVETMATTNRVILSGEISSVARVDLNQIEQTVRDVISKIGYHQSGFSAEHVQISNYLHQQSDDIALGVDKDGAGDQGIMFGYATNESEGCHFMPAPIYYAHTILKDLALRRHQNPSLGLEPDAKSQITLIYENNKPVKGHSVVVSTQHHPDLSQKQIEDIVWETLHKVLPAHFICNSQNLYINPTGRFVIGGPDGDSGLTGRKIIVDTYGGSAPHGGGAFSGKDPTKVDRSAAYMARYLAKNIVAAQLADRCLIQLSYAIGIAYPLSIYVNTFGTGKIPDSRITQMIEKNVDLTPKGIRQQLGLNAPIYLPTASYGHFGRTPDEMGHFTWEKADIISLFQKGF